MTSTTSIEWTEQSWNPVMAGARPMHPDWPRSLRAQCKVAGVPFLFKQWGEYGCIHNAKTGMAGLIVGNSVDDDHNFAMVRCGKHAAGRRLDGQLHDALPLTAHRQRTDERTPIQN
jgi:protein gp37